MRFNLGMWFIIPQHYPLPFPRLIPSRNARVLGKRQATMGLCQFVPHFVLKRACLCDVEEVSREQLATHGIGERWEEQEAQCHQWLQEGAEKPNNGVACSRVWKLEARYFKC